MTRKKIYLFQPGHYTMFQGHRSYWLPYSVGCLWSYVQQFDDITQAFELGAFVFDRRKLSQLVDSITDPAVVLFSCYIWNYQYNRQAAQAIKHRYPDCVIIFGGPQVTNRPLEKRFFKTNPWVDSIVNGEGEQALVDILRDIMSGRRVPRHIQGQRLTAVEYPSPYSGGVFDDLLAQHPDLHWQVTLETNRGCPYQCTFCDWGSATYSKLTRVPEQRVLDDIEWCGRHPIDYVYIADANFGILYNRDKAFAQKINQVQRETGRPKIVIAQWAKNSQEKILDIAKIFFQDHNRGFTLSVQSMDDTVLDAIKRRNLESSDMQKMLALCEQQGISAYTEMMLGLPHETRQSWRENHWRLMEIGQHNSVDVWTTQLLENSQLNTPEQRSEHGIEMVKVPRYVTNVVVDDNDDIAEEEYIVAGTKYMPTSDLVDSFLFSAMICHFHYITGATAVLSRFMRRYSGLAYRDFYEKLEAHTLHGDSWISNPYRDLADFMPKYLAGDLDLDQTLVRNFHSAIWYTGRPFVLDANSLMRDVRQIYTREWLALDQDLYDELMDFQDRYVIRWEGSYPMTQSYQHDFMSYIRGGELQRPVEITFDYNHEWKTSQQFLERAYHDRRTREIVNAQIKTRVL